MSFPYRSVVLCLIKYLAAYKNVNKRAQLIKYTEGNIIESIEISDESIIVKHLYSIFNTIRYNIYACLYIS